MVLCTKTQERQFDIEQMRTLKTMGFTYAQIGQNYGISRQRVQQLLRPEGFYKNGKLAVEVKICSVCGTEITGKLDIHHVNYQKNQVLPLCNSCHRKEHAPDPEFKCHECGKPIREGKFCSLECRKKFRKYPMKSGIRS